MADGYYSKTRYLQGVVALGLHQIVTGGVFSQALWRQGENRLAVFDGHVAGRHDISDIRQGALSVCFAMPSSFWG
ncbi:hypothetical protein [Halomonas llamarensis]|uniref:Transposase IS701-like DDE domain-containing protein n=1 Tax=Halomonas llamarensis TaxID=2945104 RepID=A0ABT0SLT7_9GAMM|nr:hypothetical protein [Halomonas llamarensis]MCL7928765.1 hypothetical protein [Halomonas llamarensis]